MVTDGSTGCSPGCAPGSILPRAWFLEPGEEGRHPDSGFLGRPWSGAWRSEAAPGPPHPRADGALHFTLLRDSVQWERRGAAPALCFILEEGEPLEAPSTPPCVSLADPLPLSSS